MHPYYFLLESFWTKRDQKRAAEDRIKHKQRLAFEESLVDLKGKTMIKVMSLAACAESQLYVIHEGKGELSAFSFTASGKGKYFLYKNDDLIAILFSPLNDTNVFYPHTIKCSAKDKIAVKFYNRDRLCQDMYLGFVRNPSTKK